MSHITFDEALDNNTVDLDGKFLVIDTYHDGYTGINLSKYAYRVEQSEVDGETEYEVFPVVLDQENDEYVNKDFPVIQTDGDLVFYSKNTLLDPYSGTFPEELDTLAKDSKEHNVLHAFDAYVLGAYRLNAYLVMITDEPKKVVEFEDTIGNQAPEAPEQSGPEEGTGEEPTEPEA